MCNMHMGYVQYTYAIIAKYLLKIANSLRLLKMVIVTMKATIYTVHLMVVTAAIHVSAKHIVEIVNVSLEMMERK